MDKSQFVYNEPDDKISLMKAKCCFGPKRVIGEVTYGEIRIEDPDAPAKPLLARPDRKE